MIAGQVAFLNTVNTVAGHFERNIAVMSRHHLSAGTARECNDFYTHDTSFFAGFNQIKDWEEAYLAEDELDKYASSLGHQPGDD